jgi:hypothetical protein
MIFLFLDWLNETGRGQSFEGLPVTDLAEMLAMFYAAVSPQNDAKSYSKSCYTGIRSSINRHINSPPFTRNINIMTDVEFTRANHVFVGILKKLRDTGKDTSKNHPVIQEEDIKTLYDTIFVTDNPWGLLYKVFFEICFYFARRGREGLRELKKGSFI